MTSLFSRYRSMPVRPFIPIWCGDTPQLNRQWYCYPRYSFMHQIDGSSSSIQLTSSTCCPPLRTESSSDRAHITGYTIQMRSSSRKSNRPSTAPSGDSSLLPSLHIQPAVSLNPLADVKPSLASEGDASRKMHTVLEDDADISLTFSMSVTHSNHKQ